MAYTIEDRGNEDVNRKIYSMCYNKNIPELEKYCGPDWTFYNWPSASIQSFFETINEMIKKSNEEYVIDKVGWFGNIYSPLPSVPEHKTRPLLKKIGDENPDLFEIVNIEPVNRLISSQISNYLSVPDLTKYRYLIDIGGNGYSGRLKYLLFSKRPLLIVDRDYIEYFHKDLIPFFHYIPVKQDLSDLLDQVKWMKEHPNECKEIALNAFEFATSNFSTDQLIKRIHYVYNNLK
jgi:hypothetical protein